MFTIDTTLVVLGIGFAIPFLVAVGTKLHATWQKSALAFVLAAAGAAVVALGDIGGTIGTKQFIGILITAGVTAGASRQWLTGAQVNAVSVATHKIGLGGPNPAAMLKSDEPAPPS